MQAIRDLRRPKCRVKSNLWSLPDPIRAQRPLIALNYSPNPGRCLDRLAGAYQSPGSLNVFEPILLLLQCEAMLGCTVTPSIRRRTACPRLNFL